MTMNYATESVDSVIEDIKPLLVRHWQEIAPFKDVIPLAPDWDRYRELEQNGTMFLVTAREDGVLVGYAAWLVHRGIHYSKNVFATNDVLYVVPEHRGKMTGKSLIKFSEEKLRLRGVSVISLHIKTWMDWSGLAELLGYSRTEYIHQKYIGENHELGKPG